MRLGWIGCLRNSFVLFAVCFQCAAKDDFNLTGLSSLVPYYDYALDMVLDVEMPMEDSLTEEQQEIVESAAVSFQTTLLLSSVA
jgi:transcription elongation factor Elf1